jgi:pyridinium-3,5-biscarboxylic acid mononucleotide synthase
VAKHYIDLGFAKYDLRREKIKGFPEVILALGKDGEHLNAIVSSALGRTKRLLVTRLSAQQFSSLKKSLPKRVKVNYHESAKLLFIGKQPMRTGKVVVVCAGTSDLPVAEEAAFTLEILGSKAERLYDVGVAGLHRLLDNLKIFKNANCVIVVAGMEGALPSIVGGQVSCPVIAVPTSIGYGSSFDGLAALLTMLNSCSVGISVVNIDNGFGAAYQAHMINKLANKK